MEIATYCLGCDRVFYFLSQSERKEFREQHKKDCPRNANRQETVTKGN